MSEPGVETDGERAPTAESLSTKPVVLPETYNGTQSWDEWNFHFENVTTVNGWDDTQKLRWLQVRLTGHAEKALQCLPEASRATYAATRVSLKAHFDPESRQTRYRAEFQTRRKRAGEGWADFAVDLKPLVDKAYPALTEEAREQLAINAYLQQLTQPQVAFSVKQKRPTTLDDAVAGTLEMESCMLGVGVSSTAPSTEELAVCPVVNSTQTDVRVDKLTRAVEQLTAQVERLQQETLGHRPPNTPTTGSRPFCGKCWTCRQRGHRSRDCPRREPTGTRNLQCHGAGAGG